MKKHIANMITLVRLIAAVVLLFFDGASREFLIIYGICGFTDCIDGPVARHLNIVSESGKRLDSISDVLLYSVMFIKSWPIMKVVMPSWVLYGAVVLIAIRMSLYVVYWFLHKRLLSLHSIFNKATGVAFYLLPFALRLPQPYVTYYCILALAVGCCSVTNEILYTIRELKQK